MEVKIKDQPGKSVTAVTAVTAFLYDPHDARARKRLIRNAVIAVTAVTRWLNR